MKRTLLTLAILAVLGALAAPAVAAPPVAVADGYIQLAHHPYGGGFYGPPGPPRPPRGFGYGGYYVSPPRATFYQYRSMHHYGPPVYSYPPYRVGPGYYYGGNVGVYTPGFSLQFGF